MLEVETNKDMLDGFGEEEPASVGAKVLCEDVEEEVLVKEVSESKGKNGEAVDDWGDDAIRQTCGCGGFRR